MTQAREPVSALNAAAPLTLAGLLDMGWSCDASLRALNDAARQGVGVGDGMGPLARLPRQSLEALLELGREFARSRQAQGIAAAKRKGVHLGRRFRELPPAFAEQAARYLAGEVSSRAAARACGMPPSSFLKRVRDVQPARGGSGARAVLPPPDAAYTDASTGI